MEWKIIRTDRLLDADCIRDRFSGCVVSTKPFCLVALSGCSLSSSSVELSSCWIGNVGGFSFVSISADSLIDRRGPWGGSFDDESTIAGVELVSSLSIKRPEVIDFRWRRFWSSGVIDSDCKSFLCLWVSSLSESLFFWLGSEEKKEFQKNNPKQSVCLY